ncbi:MAG: general secretion pathway protein GspK [bacterium]
MKRNRKTQSGFVLIITLWVIVVLSTSAMALLRQVQLEGKMVGFQRDTVIVDSIAKAGVRKALILLREDMIKDAGEEFQDTRLFEFGEEDNYRYDGGNELWADNPEEYIDVPFYEQNDKVGYYYVSVEDECSKFPINNPETNVDQIAHLLELTGVDEEEARTLAGAIIDWRDPDDSVTDVGGRTFGRDGSDEFTFYNSGRETRKGSVPPVVIKNAPIDSIDELLLIPGMTPAIVFGTVEPEEGGRQQRFQNRRLRKGEYLGLRHYVSVYNQKVNFNTVKREVLESLMFTLQGDQAEKLAQDWVDYRNGRDGIPGTGDDNVLKTPDNSDLDDMHYTEVNGLTDQIMQSVWQFATIDTMTFVVESLAEYQGIKKGYRVVVQRNYIPWDQVPRYGFDTDKLEDLEQVRLQIRLFEPLFDAKDRIRQVS